MKMKTIQQKLIIVLLLISEILVSGEQLIQTHVTEQEVTRENVELEAIKDVTTEGSVQNADLKERTSSLEKHEQREHKERTTVRVNQTSNSMESELVQIVLKDVTHLTNNHSELEDKAKNFTKYSVKVNTNVQNSDLIKEDLMQIVLKDLIDVRDKQRETEVTEEVFTESLATSTAEDYLTAKPSINLREFQHSNLAESELIEIVLKDVTNRTNKQNQLKYTAEVPIESLVKVNPTSNSLNNLEDPQNSNLTESGLIQIVLKDFTNLSNKQEKLNNNYKVSTESSVKVDTSSSSAVDPLNTKFSVSLEGSPSSILTEDGLMQIVAKNITNLTGKQKDIRDTEEVFIEPLLKADATSFVQDQFTTKSLIMPKTPQNSKMPENELLKLEKNLKDVTMTVEVSTESLAKVDASTIAEHQLTTKPLISQEVSENSVLTESELIQKVLKEVPETLVDENATSSSEEQLPTKSVISLEEYAVKQMNFILDHLLMETQEFVAKVLQASINSVFRKDHLKRYAEDINRILNPDDDGDYSDEIIKDKKIYTQDEVYEKIIQKLNFFKSKSTKSLPKSLPQEWINDYRNKRAELAIWLDKAAEEMHTEFNCYLTEAEDHIKYQYVNDTFEDISRATEIHHKLALLAELVKIVKNKKQITFMDLYMQT